MNQDLTLRDYFAVVALQGLLASSGQVNDRSVVFAAYQYADMMIEARSQKNG
jgi:hypothetical protein